MKTLNAALPVFPGFYGTYFEPDETCLIEDGRTSDDYEFDYSDYYEQMGSQCVDAVEMALLGLDFDVRIKYVKIWSPREYNFTNDAILAEYKLLSGCLAKIKAYIKANKEAFSVYLKDTFSSRSGFVSFYSNDYDTWLDFINLKSFESDQIYLEHVLNFILLNEKYDAEALYNDVSDKVYLDGSLKEPEEDEDEEEKDLGKLWSYTPILELFNDVRNPRQLKLPL